MSDTFFTILYFVFIFAASIIRGVYTKQFKQNREYTDKLDKFLTILPILGMFILPLIYALTSWLDFADYQLPGWAGWIGAAIFALRLWVLWRSHADLVRQWSVKVDIQEEHKLVTDGIFKHIRHPMYAAHILWGSSTAAAVELDRGVFHAGHDLPLGLLSRTERGNDDG